MTTPTARVAPLPFIPVSAGSMNKVALRRLMRERRATCDPALGARLAAHLAGSPPVLSASVVAGYWPLTGEVDIRPALTAATARGQVVALPVTPRSGEPLLFRRWEPGARLHPGPFGTWEPDGAPVEPGVLLVPLLAFDRTGGRLGYGGGFYDRTFATLRQPFVAIGCGFGAQEVDSLPMEKHDRRMDAIVTEIGLFFTGSSFVE